MTDHRQPVDEFAQLAEAMPSREQFYRQLLPRLTARLSAAGTAVWTCDDASIQPFMKHGVDALPANGQLDRHHSLLEKVQRAGQPAYVVPKSAGAATDNPTDFVLGICPVKVEDTVVALLESFLPGDLESGEREADLQVLRSVARIAGRFHRQAELHELREHQDWWRQFETFTQSVHASLHPTQTSYTIANEGRRIIGCDRLSVLLRHGHKYRVAAISGQASIHRRANAVVLMQKLVNKVLVLRKPFYYPTSEADLAPQLEEALDCYLDVAETNSLAIVPLINKQETSEDPVGVARPGDVIGALVAEQFSGEVLASELIDAVARQATSGLGNAQEHHRVFLLPLWSAIGKLLSIPYLPKTLFVTLLLAAAVLGLVFVRVDFDLSAEGTLQPELRRYVFAESDGVVDQLNVKHGSSVEQGAVLARLRSSEIDLQLAEIRGELETAGRKLAATKAARIANSARTDRSKLNQLAAEEEALRRELTNLQQQQTLLLERKESLLVRSPIDGEVTTWDLENLMTARPVTRGDILMTLATTEGAWVVELLLSDRRAGHLRDAQRRLGDELDVTYILATNPGQQLHGKIQKIGHATVVDPQEGLALPVTIEIDEADIGKSRPGAKVIAKIRCGQAPIGYVWLHEVFEFIQSRVLFRI